MKYLILYIIVYVASKYAVWWPKMKVPALTVFEAKKSHFHVLRDLDNKFQGKKCNIIRFRQWLELAQKND